MVESTENIIRICFTNHGYLINQNFKIEGTGNTPPEVDLIAVRLKKLEGSTEKHPINEKINNLPNKLAIEIKRWKAPSKREIRNQIKVIFKKDNEHKGYKKNMEEHIEKIYGKGFEFLVILQGGSKQEAIDYIKEQEVFGKQVNFLALEEIIDWVKKFAKQTRTSYSNDEIDTLRLMSLFSKKNEKTKQ